MPTIAFRSSWVAARMVKARVPLAKNQLDHEPGSHVRRSDTFARWIASAAPELREDRTPASHEDQAAWAPSGGADRPRRQGDVAQLHSRLSLRDGAGGGGLGHRGGR